MKLFFILFNLGVLSVKQVSRYRTRSTLTLLGVISGMFLFTTIETIQSSLQEATALTATDTTLVVYREIDSVQQPVDYPNTTKVKLPKFPACVPFLRFKLWSIIAAQAWM